LYTAEVRFVYVLLATRSSSDSSLAVVLRCGLTLLKTLNLLRVLSLAEIAACERFYPLFVCKDRSEPAVSRPPRLELNRLCVKKSIFSIALVDLFSETAMSSLESRSSRYLILGIWSIP